MWYDPQSCRPPHKKTGPIVRAVCPTAGLAQALGLLRSSRLAREPNYLLRIGGPVIYFKSPDPGCNLYPGNFGPSRGSDLGLRDFASKVKLQKYRRCHFSYLTVLDSTMIVSTVVPNTPFISRRERGILLQKSIWDKLSQRATFTRPA